jgi:hypothetical protein
LIPFLLARSGQALDEFCLWVAQGRTDLATLKRWLGRASNATSISDVLP